MLTFLAPRASANVTFSFNFTDAAGVGFNAAGQAGLDRRNALANAAGRISTYFANYSATIILDVNGSVTNDSTLASAGSNFNAPYPGVGFGDKGDVMLKILGGDAADPNASMADGVVNWNFQDHNWATGDTILSGQYDMVSTAMHELAHALGFAAGVAEDGSDYWGHSLGAASTWTPMDRYLADSSGALINGSYQMNVSRWNTAKVGGSNNGLFFNGPNAIAAYGGPVPLYSPLSYEPGSSGGSHLDDGVFTGANRQLMNAMSAPPGTLDARVFSSIEQGVLKDIGYIALVPEPGSLLALGLGTISLLRRRRK